MPLEQTQQYDLRKAIEAFDSDLLKLESSKSARELAANETYQQMKRLALELKR